MMALGDETTFARLVPVNYLAQRLLRDSVEVSEAAANAYRLKFVEKSEPRPFDGVMSESDVALASELSTFDSNLILSLEPEMAPANMSHGWRVGKESAKGKKPSSVELVVAEPSSPFARAIANVAAFFRFHPKSAMLLLVATSDDKPVSILYDGEWVSLGTRQARVLYQPLTRLRFGDLEYELRYTIEEKDEKGFIKLRDEFIHRATGCKPSVSWSVPPHITFEKRGSVLFNKSTGHGTFAITSRGVDSENGDLLAIKELQLKSTGDLKRATLEMQVASTCSSMDGHLPLQVSWCEHGSATPCGLLPERFFMAFPLGVTDFSKLGWNTIPASVRVELLLQVLMAISKMHEAGFMHRDVSLKNMLLVTQDPPTAVVIDYGKSTAARQHTDSRIGPIPTIAPEVMLAGVPYTNKIDVWSWGYAVAEIYGYSFKPLAGESYWITEKRLVRIHRHLSNLPLDDPAEAKLIELVMRTLSWKVDDRPSAAAALQEIGWDAEALRLFPSSASSDSEPSTGSKRIKPDVSQMAPLSQSSSNPTATDPLSQSPEAYLGKRIKVEDEAV